MAKATASGEGSRPSKRPRTLSSKHYDAFRKAGRDWSKPSPFHDTRNREMFPGIARLVERQIDILDRHNIQVPEVRPRTVDYHESIDFSKVRDGVAPCLTGGSELWLGHRV